MDTNQLCLLTKIKVGWDKYEVIKLKCEKFVAHMNHDLHER